MKPHACHNSWGLKHGTSHMGDTASFQVGHGGDDLSTALFSFFPTPKLPLLLFY